MTPDTKANTAGKVKRYTLSTGFPREHEDGKYVLSRDYDALSTENAALRAEIALLKEGWPPEEVARIEARALVAEGLKRLAESHRDRLAEALRTAINRLSRYESELPNANDDLRAALTAPGAAGEHHG